MRTYASRMVCGLICVSRVTLLWSAQSMQAARLEAEKIFLAVVTRFVVAKCTIGRRCYRRVFSVTRRHAEHLSDKRAGLSLEGATALESTTDDRRALARVLLMKQSKCRDVTSSVSCVLLCNNVLQSALRRSPKETER